MNMWDLQLKLKELGWSQAEFGRRIKRNKNTISNWVKKGTPEEVKRYLDLLIRLKREVE